jgi:hypothetical protein
MRINVLIHGICLIINVWFMLASLRVYARYGAVGTVTGYGLGGRGSEFEPR